MSVVTINRFSLECKNNILNLNRFIITVIIIMFMLTSVLYKCFYCTVINSYICIASWFILWLLELCLYKAKRILVSLLYSDTHTFAHTYTPPIWPTHTLKLPQSHREEEEEVWVRGGGGGVTRRLYVRLRVWKILDIWSMTGPVSGSFIHWVLFRGFSSMSSNAAHKHKTDRVCQCKCTCKYRNMKQWTTWFSPQLKCLLTINSICSLLWGLGGGEGAVVTKVTQNTNRSHSLKLSPLVILVTVSYFSEPSVRAENINQNRQTKVINL